MIIHGFTFIFDLDITDVGRYCHKSSSSQSTRQTEKRCFLFYIDMKLPLIIITALKHVEHRAKSGVRTLDLIVMTFI